MACADAGAGNSSAATGSAAASLARLDIEFLLGERDEPEAAIFDGVANAKIAAEVADDAADHANLLDWHQDVAVGPRHGRVGADVGGDCKRRLVRELVQYAVRAGPPAVV